MILLGNHVYFMDDKDMSAHSKPNDLLERFKILLNEYSRLVGNQESKNQSKLRLQNLLAGFHVKLIDEAKESKNNRGVLERLLKGFLEKRCIWAENQKYLAEDFNILEVIDLDSDEVTHSKLLAWLLDKRIEHGTHAQGNLGFKLFLREFGKELLIDKRPEILTYADKNYWVYTDPSGDKSRIDIEIAARKEFIIHIENKIYSEEGIDQTKREWEDLIKRAKDLEIRESNIHAFFLTLDGKEASKKEFLPITWSRIASVLDKFANQAHADEVKLFAYHYAKSVHKLTRTRYSAKDIENAKEII